MNLYLISQNKNTGYETYDRAIVAAETKKIAQNISPDGSLYKDNDWSSDWCNPEFVNVTLIGTALPGLPRGVVLSSFNAG